MPFAHSFLVGSYVETEIGSLDFGSCYKGCLSSGRCGTAVVELLDGYVGELELGPASRFFRLTYLSTYILF